MSTYPGEEVERVQVAEATFLRILGEATGSLEAAGIGYGLMGGIASAVFGRARSTLDVDIFVRPQTRNRRRRGWRRPVSSPSRASTTGSANASRIASWST